MFTEHVNIKRLLRRVAPTIVTLFLVELPLRAVAADCPSFGGLVMRDHFYNGRLGNGETVRAVLAFRNCSVSGAWFDSIWFEDYKVDGSLSSGWAVTLTLRTASNEVLATVRGRFPQSDPFGKVSGSLTSDLLLGLMSGTRGYNGQTVELRQSSAGDNTDAQVAAVVGIADQAAFNRATLNFWRAVRDHDVAGVAECLHYPVSARVVDWTDSPLASRTIIVRDSAMLKDHYDQIFDWFLRDQILGELPRHLIWGAEVHTVVLGGDAAVFDPKGQVIALGSAYSSAADVRR